MALKSYKPTTPGQRGLVLIDRSELYKGRPVKALTEGLTKKGGRNNTGRITARRRGGGAKRLYRIVDFKRNKFDVNGIVVRIEYDPNRTAFIALIQYDDGEQAYILAPQRLGVGDKIVSSESADIKPGNTKPFSRMPIGTIVHNIELKPGKGGQIARAAGTYAQFVGRDGGYAQIRLSSGELRMVRQECLATVGAVSNPDNSNQNLGKAGRVRHMGKRPSVRGVVMNPIDHPHGGGEGRTSGGRHPVTPWGKPTKGKRTRNPNKASSRLIVRSRHAKKKGR
ncbi:MULTISPECIES: 50S ribosomal protein L2 [Ponticoccus]|uniref:Large ribosomal subunit protein uL2 n=1 Tax=Ponticoccus litoralis TaxID=422297 RepID=A0AAW9SSA1_9RHOB|nr:50S ribosomal protein L2 [Enemella evansiae]